MYLRKWLASNFLVKLIISIAVTFLLASSFHTFIVLNNLVALGTNINFKTRLLVTINDVIGLTPTYLPLIVIALSIAIPFAHFLSRYKPFSNRALFPIAGFAAITMLLLLMYSVLNVSIIAGARGTFGLLLQGLAGCVGGMIYAYLSQIRT